MIQRKSKVVKLPTDDCISATIYINQFTMKLTPKNKQSRELGKLVPKYHLYFLSEDKIKEGDWVLSLEDNIMEKVTDINSKTGVISNSNTFAGYLLSQVKKIIATTDPSLNLPRPSDSFIKKYCEVGGINEVMVEYETHGIVFHDETDGIWIDLPKVASDNTITIHESRNSWSREEIESILFKYAEEHALLSTKSEIDEFNEWLKENLNYE